MKTARVGPSPSLGWWPLAHYYIADLSLSAEIFRPAEAENKRRRAHGTIVGQGEPGFVLDLLAWWWRGFGCSRGTEDSPNEQH